MKKKIFTLITSVALCSMGLMAQEVATWEDWAKSAITFTFDDGANEANSHSWAAQQLDQYGFKATFYVVTGWTNGQWGTYKSIAQKGHEIGSHTDSHSTNAGELSSSKNTIEREIGQPCLTIAYPNCNEISNTLNYYIGGRICGGQTNSKSPQNLARFDCQICGDQGINSQSQFTSRCSGANGGWMVFLIHGIQGRQANGSYSPTSADAFTGTLKWLDQNKSDYWVCTARDAIMYLKERDAASFKKVSSDASSDTYSLTLNSSLTSNTLCKWDYPLSVRVPMQSGWANMTVKQSDKELEFEEKNGYVYFKAVPNGGDIVVGSGKPAVPEPEFTLTVSSAEKYCKDSSYSISWTLDGDVDGRTYSLNFGSGSSSTEVSIKDVSASSEWENNGTPYWTVDKILSDDGNHGGSSRWGTMTGSNEWVAFDFGKTQTVGGIKIDECTEYSLISSFEVQYDENGSWKTAYSGKTVGHDFKATFDPVSTQKMRLLIKSTNDGDGCNINYVEFSGVAGYVIKDGINAAGNVTWKPKAAGTGDITITNSRGTVLAKKASVKVENCGGESGGGESGGGESGGGESGHGTQPVTEIDPCEQKTKQSGSALTVTSNGVKEIGNGYNVEMWNENGNGSVTCFGGDAECAFKANWNNSGDYLARVGYYDGSSKKNYKALGTIKAGYNYTKSGNGGGNYSYIGVYGWTKSPMIEYYIVDDSFTPNGGGMYWGANQKGTYTMDGAQYRLMVGQRNNAPCITGNNCNFQQVFAVRSNSRTCGTISVSDHFKEWEKLGVDMSGGIYDCKIVCEVGGGQGSIEYTYASMCWDGCKGKGSICAKATVSVEDFESEEEEDIILMPNPAENYFIVKSEKAIDRIELINIFGQTVYSKSNSDKVEFNLPAGTYVVKIATEDGAVSAKRLIVK
ncbi:MAG: glycoside hydrolase family 11 protein [Paludibacteraceae bacterium]|nr:glycoside hydrolase family 11 protein [Paludibacteraceae bacterium]